MKDLNYSNNIYALRKERNVSQNKMAEATGISRRTISMIENGEQNVSLDYAYRISAYFNLLVQEVFPVMTNEESRDKKIFTLWDPLHASPFSNTTAIPLRY